MVKKKKKKQNKTRPKFNIWLDATKKFGPALLTNFWSLNLLLSQLSNYKK